MDMEDTLKIQKHGESGAYCDSHAIYRKFAFIILNSTDLSLENFMNAGKFPRKSIEAIEKKLTETHCLSSSTNQIQDFW